MKKSFLIKNTVLNYKIFHFVILTCFIYSTHLLAGKIYKWKDENGAIHFTSTPPKSNHEVTTVGTTKSKVKVDVNEAI